MAANNSLVTQFNAAPYFDDFEEKKNFHRIVFKPGLAVQARELTQVQTILQNQIDRFAEHIFKEGSLVTGGQFNFNNEYDYVKLKDNTPANTSVSVSNFKNKTIVGATTGVSAYVLDTATGSEASANTKTLFVRYTSSGTNNTTKYLLPNENITANGYIATIINANTAVKGYGSLFSISPGIVFAKDHFIRFDEQSLVLSRYTNTPTLKVGFEIKEEIIDSNLDYTLTDPAQGSYNYAAPGADRLKLTANLKSYAVNANTGLSFVELFRVKDGVIQKKFEKTQYSVIQDEWARRTSDESGDYYVNGLNIRVREHLDNGTNQGYLTLGNGGLSSKIAVGVEPGKAYVKGYEIEKLVTEYVAINKGTAYKDLDQQSIGINYGNYIIVNELVGSWDVNSGTVINLYDTAQVRISGRKWSTTAQTGALVGTARFKALEYSSGVIGTATAQYRIYLYDIKMTSGDFRAVRNIYFDNSSTADMGADLVLVGGNAVVYETSFDRSLYEIPTSSLRALRDNTNAIDNVLQVLKSYSVTIATNGTFTLATGLSDEIYPYGVGALNDTQKRQILVQLNGTATVTMAGTATTASGSGAVTGSGTTFTNLNIGDKVEFTGVSGTYFVTAITNATNMTISPVAASTGTGVTFRKAYYTGDLVDFTIKGGTGVTRTVTLSNSTTAAFDMRETLSNTVSATVSAIISKIDGKEIKKTIRRNRLVIIDVAPGTVNGPWNLGFADVYKINSVRLKTGSTFASTSEGTLVSSSFILDDGQRDNHYDHAKLIKSNSSLTLTGSDFLLVNLDYFVHDFSQGSSYFSIDSYPIDDVNGSANTNAITTETIPIYTSPITGKSFDLRNTLDTRSSKANVANDATTIGACSTNPATSDTFNIPSGGIKVPAPNNTFIVDYSYYLGRKDLIVLNSQGIISSVTGNPALVPITPELPADSFALATIEVAPYPSLSPAYATTVNRLDLANKVNKTANKRFTMRDIGVLKNRIDNLEYYTSLSLLEKDASDMKIVDSNGLDRFKNGIFVDPFTSHALGDAGNPDYKIAVDPGETLIRPRFELNNVQLEYASGTNVVNSNNFVTMSFTETSLIQQLKASTTRNLAGLYYKFIGQMTLDPADDFWVDTQVKPDLQVDLGSSNNSWNLLNNTFETQWNSWQTMSTGVNVRNTSTGQQTTTTTLGAGAPTTNTRTVLNQLRPGQSATITTSQNQVRSGSRLNVTTEVITENLGTRVVDVSAIPYIRPQVLRCSVFGVKPSTKLYVYFDGENMTSYSTPTNSQFVASVVEGSDIISDSVGTAYFKLRLPSTVKRFRTGTKSVRVSDSPTNASDTTTSATTQFVAQGLVQQKQDTVVSTSVPRFSNVSVEERRTVTTNQTVSVPSPPPAPIVEPRRDRSDPPGRDPLTQSFKIELPKNVPGCFVTSVNIYFASKDPVHGVKIELREMDSASQITNRVIPYSENIKPSSQINVSNDGSVPTRIYFNSPVYLVNGAEYGLCIIPMANNPNTAVWTAIIGQNDIVTNDRISTQPYTGVLYASSNNGIYTPLQEEDMKFEIFRASFTTNTTGVVNIRNKPTERFELTSFSGTSFVNGEEVEGETRITVSSWVGGTPANNNIIKGGTSLAEGIATNYVSGTTVRLRDVTIPRKFVVGGTVSVFHANNVSRGITGVITNIIKGTANLDKVSVLSNGNYLVTLRNSNGDFNSLTEQVKFQTSGITGTRGTTYPLKYSTLDMESSFLSFDGTTINWSTKTTSNTNVVSSTFDPININENTSYNSERVVLGRLDEIANISSAYSLTPKAEIFTSSDYVSPAIDIERLHTVLVHNIVNNDFTNETSSVGGNILNKYISGKITLNDGQDAEDLKVYLTAYKPPSATVRVYAKILNSEDSDVFNDRPWIELELNTKDIFSDSEVSGDFKEYTYGIPASMLIGAGGSVRYTNSASINFTGFKYFAIKIALGSTNSANVPKCSDLRVIALQI